VRQVSDRGRTRDRLPNGVSAGGTAVLRRQLRRGQVLAFFARLEPCLIGMEACSGAH
jgi:transposase